MNKQELMEKSFKIWLHDNGYKEPGRVLGSAFNGGFNASFNILSMTKKYHRDILIYSFRYSIGRKSYSTSIVQDVIRDLWPELSEHDRKLIKREIKEYKEQYGCIGMDCDNTGWKSLLNLVD